MKKGIIICITAGLAAFALTFLGLTMVNRMAARELKPSNWLQETTEILVEDPPLRTNELEQEEETKQQKLPAVEVGSEPAEPVGGGAVCELVTVTSDKCTEAAYEIFASSMTWSEHGWLCACGLDPATSLPEVASELPEFTLAEDFAMELKAGAVLQGIVIYDKNFQELQMGASLEDIQTLKYGKYYISYEILEQGAYIASEGQYETTEYSCIFGLIVSAINEII